MPRAIEHDRELRDKGLVTVFLESQGAAADDLDPFVWSRWPGFDARLASNSSLPLPEFSGLPHGALIGVDGTLLWDGSPSAGEKKFMELVDAELQKVQKGWGDTPDVRRVRAALFGKGNFAEARKLLEAVAAEQMKSQLAKEIDDLFARRVAAIKFLKDANRLVESRDLGAALLKGSTGADDLQKQADELVAWASAPEAKKDLQQDEKLQKLLRSIRDEKVKGPFAKPLQALAKGAADTKVAARIAQLIATVEAAEKAKTAER